MRMLALFDISKQNPRQKVGDVLLEYGVRVQKSAFEIDLDPSELDKLRRRLERLLDPKTDRLAFYPVDRRGRRRVIWLGSGPIQTLPENRPSYFIA